MYQENVADLSAPSFWKNNLLLIQNHAWSLLKSPWLGQRALCAQNADREARATRTAHRNEQGLRVVTATERTHRRQNALPAHTAHKELPTQNGLKKEKKC